EGGSSGSGVPFAGSCTAILRVLCARKDGEQSSGTYTVPCGLFRGDRPLLGVADPVSPLVLRVHLPRHPNVLRAQAHKVFYLVLALQGAPVLRIASVPWNLLALLLNSGLD